jgi:hypothetical protein
MLTIPESKGIMRKPEGIIGASSEKRGINGSKDEFSRGANSILIHSTTRSLLKFPHRTFGCQHLSDTYWFNEFFKYTITKNRKKETQLIKQGI